MYVRKEKQLVKVVGSMISGIDDNRSLTTIISRGIVQLKRGTTLAVFARTFLEERSITTCELHSRGDNTIASSPAMFLDQKPKFVITYTFTQFNLSEIGYYGKDLTKVELYRDFKFLKKVLA